MQIYLPIAEMPVDPLVVMIMGGGVGFLSGMFGVGGGFLMTPLLIFYGIPAPVAVGTEASQIVASSVSGVTAHLKRKTVDFQMGGFLVLGGGLGALLGILLFRYLSALGQIDLIISLSYVSFLGVIGGLMLVESINTLRKTPDMRPRRKKRSAPWMAALPFAMRFRRSGLYISPIPPIILGMVVG
ncbi:MAG: sulfite exporter TauE/SafE family protein, partial [Pseudomonadota bacterium]